MQTVRMRIIGSDTDTQSMISILHGVDGVQRIEEMQDLLPHMDDEDSSSAGLHDQAGAGVHEVEIIAPSAESVRRVHDVAEIVAREYDGVVEFPENV